MSSESVCHHIYQCLALPALYRMVSFRRSRESGIIHFVEARLRLGRGGALNTLAKPHMTIPRARFPFKPLLLCLQLRHRDDDQNVASFLSRCSISWTTLSMHLAPPPAGIMTTVIPLSPRPPTLYFPSPLPLPCPCAYLPSARPSLQRPTLFQLSAKSTDQYHTSTPLFRWVMSRLGRSAYRYALW